MASAGGPAPINKTNLIVNYLPQNFTDSDFQELFSKIGTVTASKIVRDRSTGYSYGFGFIDYATEEEAAQAIEQLNGCQVQHKKIKVSYARQGDNVKGANLYLRNLPKHLTEDSLQELFSPFGHIVQTRVLLDSNNESRGIGFVLFSTREQAQNALDALDGQTPNGFTQPLSVKFAEDNRLKMRPNPMAPISPNNIPVGYMHNMNFGGGGPMRNQQIRARYNPMTVGPAPVPPAGMAPLIPAATELGFVLFVYNIGSTTDEYSLWEMFSPYGIVQKVSVVRDPVSKASKGYGFVTMANYGEAVGAIYNLNGLEFNGGRLQVSFKNK